MDISRIGALPPQLPPTIGSSGLGSNVPASVTTVGNVLSALEAAAMNCNPGDVNTLSSQIQMAIQALAGMHLGGQVPTEAQIQFSFSEPCLGSNSVLVGEIGTCSQFFDLNASLYTANQTTSGLVMSILGNNAGPSPSGAIFLSQVVLAGAAYPDNNTTFLQESLGTVLGTVPPGASQVVNVLSGLVAFGKTLTPNSLEDQCFLSLTKGAPLSFISQGYVSSGIENLVGAFGRCTAPSAFPIFQALTGSMNIAQLWNMTTHPSSMVSAMTEIVTMLNSIPSDVAPVTPSFISALLSSSHSIANLNSQNVADLCTLIPFQCGLNDQQNLIFQALLKGVDITQLAGNVGALENAISQIPTEAPNSAAVALMLIGNLTFPPLTETDLNNLGQLVTVCEATPSEAQEDFFLQLVQGMNLQTLRPYAQDISALMTAASSNASGGVDHCLSALTGGVNIQTFMSGSADPAVTLEEFTAAVVALKNYDDNHSAPISAAYVSSWLAGKTIAQLTPEEYQNFMNNIGTFS